MSAAPARPGDSVIATLRATPGPVWALLIGTFINKLGAFLQVFLVLFLISRGLTAGQAGLALGAYGAGSVIGVFAGGGITDRVGCRWTISVSMVLAGVFTAALLSTTNVFVVLALAFANGATSQAYRPAASALIAALTPEDRHVMVFAIWRLAFNLGMTVGPMVGAVVVSTGSFAVLFWADAVTSIAFGVVALFALPGGAVDRTTTAGEGEGDGEGPSRAGGYRRLFADRRYRLFVGALFLNAIVYCQYLAVLPLHVEDAGLPTGLFGVLVGVNGLIVILFELPATRVVQRWSARLSVPLGIGMIGVGLTMYAGPAVAAWLVVATVVWSMGEIVGAPTASAYPARVAPPGLRGRYLATAATSQSVGYAVGPPIGAFVWAWWGDGVWWLCGLLTVAAVVAAVRGIDPAAAHAARAEGPPGEGGVEANVPVTTAGATDPEVAVTSS